MQNFNKLFVEKLNEARKQNEYITKIKGVNYYVNEKQRNNCERVQIS